MFEQNDNFNQYAKAFDDPLIVSIDFDETFSTNQIAWLKVINVLKSSGFKVICCTSRYYSESPEELDILKNNDVKCYFTCGEPKEEYLLKKGVKVNIWIDDNPSAILYPV